MTKRNANWREALIAYLGRVKRTPYRPGKHDCALFAADAVAAMTGDDYAAPFRGRYKTIRGGMRVLRKAGFTDHVALAEAHLTPIPPAMVRAGDLAVVPGEGGAPSLGVVQGEKVYVLTPAGVGLVSILKIQRGFQV